MQETRRKRALCRSPKLLWNCRRTDHLIYPFLSLVCSCLYQGIYRLKCGFALYAYLVYSCTTVLGAPIAKSDFALYVDLTYSWVSPMIPLELSTVVLCMHGFRGSFKFVYQIWFNENDCCLISNPPSELMETSALNSG